MNYAAVAGALSAFAVLQLPTPAHAQLFDPYIIGMMAGPVSDGPSVLLLKKREEKFLSTDTLAIACVAGAASSVVAHGLPAIAVAMSGIGFPIGAASLAGSSVFGCLVGAGGGATAMATQVTLNAVHRLESRWTSPEPLAGAE
ncbi:MAG: hypothetical protein WCJ64_16415 [Rhodospirillaceae bacterium]